MIKTIDIYVDQSSHKLDLVSVENLLNVEDMHIIEQIYVRQMLNDFTRIRTVTCNDSNTSLNTSATPTYLKIIPISTLTGTINDYKNRTIYDLSYTSEV